MKLEFNGVNKHYGSTHALKDFTFTFEPGIYALLGPNGAGKSTFMNILVDNLQADSGQVLLDGRDTRAMSGEFRGRIGFMPQQQQLYQTMTAERFLYYMAALKNLSITSAKEQIDSLLEFVNLSDSKRRKIGAFSGGMKQRILIAQALLGNPSILVLDEPTAGLDPKERVRMRNLIVDISKGRIVIFATHVVSDIESIATEILFLKKGELIAAGAKTVLTERLRTVYDLPPGATLEDLYMSLFGDD